MPKIATWRTLGFGKHSDLTLPQLLFADPEYFFWAMDTRVFETKSALLEQARVIYRRARAVKIPDNEDGALEVEHIISPVNYTYARFDIEPVVKAVHRGGSPAYRAKFIDFSVPRSLKSYDKSGYKLFIDSVKLHVFKNPKIRMTKKVCEDFFSDPNNFANP